MTHYTNKPSLDPYMGRDIDTISRLERELAAARAELERVRDMAKLHGKHHRQCVRLLAGLAHTTDADCNCWLSHLDNPPPHTGADLANLEPSQ